MASTKTWKRWGSGAGLVAAGLIAGGVLAGTVTASAEEDGTTGTSASSDEQPLTGDTKTQVEEAVLEAYPGATIERSETDDGGVYEAHITTADGEELTVEVGEDFTVTGTETGGHGRGHRDGGGQGEQALTGDTKTQVEDAVLEAYPGATIERSETDNGGVYEAHITTADGEELTVEVGEDFTVTGTETGGHGGGHHGDRDSSDD
ncbi:hypothetical protein [Blastococcus sp. TF02-09]|uniref:hypothetical protein n=1 Tax=Blastococcus sp. TF02-09 TaxID=2250576 RepID=UPI0018F77C60|nr:hypothetical protein [Blastococcus sp. TF02-9]